MTFVVIRMHLLGVVHVVKSNLRGDNILKYLLEYWNILLIKIGTRLNLLLCQTFLKVRRENLKIIIQKKLTSKFFVCMVTYIEKFKLNNFVYTIKVVFVCVLR